ncbi:MAG: type II toxin-antitoxin system RelE/ParE family toxin [Rhodospirillales bacterium]|nr:type II toxin-antitoxin system RelE/ParE family toxin [Rhodospirillales bacterium]
MNVEWHAAALADRDAAVLFLEERNPHAAVRLLQALIVAADILVTFPTRGRQAWLQAPGSWSPYPCLLVYEADAVAEIVRTLRVWHGVQDR